MNERVRPELCVRPFSGGSQSEISRILGFLRIETVGGLLLLLAAAMGLALANSPWSDVYQALGDVRLGPNALSLNLSFTAWSSDGLLAIFFFVAGLELKREFVAGKLRTLRKATLPVVAAVGGMVVPALIYIAVNISQASGELRGWAAPIATDAAFALAVLAVVSTHLPSALRMFLLTLAVVDDLLAITIIAAFYTSSLQILPLLLAVLPLGAFGLLVQRGVRFWWLLLPLAVLTWALMHASGVHATVAGVLLSFAVPARRRELSNGLSLAEHFKDRLHPFSAGLAVPIFAFFAVGISAAGIDSPGSLLTDPIVLGIVLGLSIGKPLGVFGFTFLVERFTRVSFVEDFSWWDVLGLSMLTGVGFTVSLLIGELAFGASSSQDDLVKVGVLVGSIFSALLAAIVLRARNRVYRRYSVGAS